MGRMAKPEESASVIAFLLSGDAAYMTGAQVDDRLRGKLSAGTGVAEPAVVKVRLELERLLSSFWSPLIG